MKMLILGITLAIAVPSAASAADAPGTPKKECCCCDKMKDKDCCDKSSEGGNHAEHEGMKH